MSFINKYNIPQPYNGGSRLKAQYRPAETKSQKTAEVDAAPETYGPCSICAESDDPRDITIEGSDRCKRCFAVARSEARNQRQQAYSQWLENKEEYGHECYSGLECGQTAYDRPDFAVMYCDECYARKKSGKLRQCAGSPDENQPACTLLGPHKYCQEHMIEQGGKLCSEDGCGRYYFGDYDYCTPCYKAWKAEESKAWKAEESKVYSGPRAKKADAKPAKAQNKYKCTLCNRTSTKDGDLCAFCKTPTMVSV